LERRGEFEEKRTLDALLDGHSEEESVADEVGDQGGNEQNENLQETSEKW
jgi:hypothetical protein